MQYRDLRNKAKKLGLRVTKNVDGKRVKLTGRELRSKITMNFENSVKNAQKVIKICKTVLISTPTGATPRPPPPPPPPPPRMRPLTRPPVNNTRARLLAELKGVQLKKGLRNKI
jgi:hypothetical protein